MIRHVQDEGVEFSGQEDEQQEILPPLTGGRQRRVYAEKSDPTIEGLYRQFQRGQLDLQPQFQRGYIWDDAKASRLIESVLLGVPIPNIYLAQEQDGKNSVIDGQQRLTSFFRVFQPVPLGRGGEAPKLRLRGLRVLTNLNGTTFDSTRWNEADQAKFEQTAVRAVTIQKESDPQVKYEVFERLNSGAMGLNDQELRNCIYRGSYNELLHELSEDTAFQALLGWKEPDKRMRDIELVLRFFAFRRVSHLNYKSPMKGFLNKEMEQHRYMDRTEEGQLRTQFKEAVASSKSIFGNRAFRRFVTGNEQNPNGQWERPLNKGLYDIVMWGFAQYPRHQVMQHADAIREKLLQLMSYDQDFVDSIMIGTNDASKVQTRFGKWQTSLEENLGRPHHEQRLFSAADKERLFRALNGDICTSEGGCGQKILSIDDAEVDHIAPYSKGGKTELSNARLLHRYCNRKRGARA